MRFAKKTGLLFLAAFALNYTAPITAANAQEGYQVEEFEELDIETKAFPNTKKGCAKKVSFFIAIADNYRKGTDPDDLGSMKIMKPLVQNIYDKIGKDGLSDSYLSALQDYQKCAKDADQERNEEKEAEQAALYKQCGGINEVVLGALEDVKRNGSVKRTAGKYGSRRINTEGTAMEGMESPAVYLVEEVYKNAETSYDAAVDFAVSQTVGCLNQ